MAKQFKELMPSLWTQGQEAPSPDASETLTKCPVCGDELTFSGGCNMCKSCGWSKCD
jgi:ribonucleoside-diphosphate reductase alpha chain